MNRVTDYTQIVMATAQSNSELGENISTTLISAHEHPILFDKQQEESHRKYIVRRLTPLECSRLQGFPDGWSEIDPKDDFTDEEEHFWQEVRRTYYETSGKTYKPCSKERLLKWYNSLHSDSAEYRMWGNGIALPCASFVMTGIAKVLKEELLKNE